MQYYSNLLGFGIGHFAALAFASRHWALAAFLSEPLMRMIILITLMYGALLSEPRFVGPDSYRE